MAISSINMAMGASYGAYNQKLTQATRQKLIELGIPFDNNITEQEGQSLIKRAEQTKDTKKQESDNNSSASQNDLFKKAVELAKKLGIETNEQTNFQTLLSVIESTLEQKIMQNQNNVDMLKQLKGLSQDLAFIQAQSSGASGYDSTNQALMKSLEVLSQYNKNFLYN